MAKLIAEYYAIFYAWYGSLPIPCFFCGEQVTQWGRQTWDGHIHHVDGDHSNDDPLNLAAVHVKCHIQYHSTGSTQTPESNEKRTASLKEKSVCGSCGGRYNVVWMTRHVNTGKCLNPTEEQIAAGERLRTTNTEMARNQWKDGKATVYERTPEVRKKISQSLTGKIQSEESNQKRSVSLKKAYEEGRKAKPTGRPKKSGS